MVDSESSDALWQSDPSLSEVIENLQAYETWVETDDENLKAMDESILRVIELVELRLAPLSAEELPGNIDTLIESMLVILGFMPAKKALTYLMEFQRYQGFFEAIAVQLVQAPPLKSYAKTLLARASVLQQRELQKAVNSEENFSLLVQALERAFEKS